MSVNNHASSYAHKQHRIASPRLQRKQYCRCLRSNTCNKCKYNLYVYPPPLPLSSYSGSEQFSMGVYTLKMKAASLSISAIHTSDDKVLYCKDLHLHRHRYKKYCSLCFFSYFQIEFWALLLYNVVDSLSVCTSICLSICLPVRLIPPSLL